MFRFWSGNPGGESPGSPPEFLPEHGLRPGTGTGGIFQSQGSKMQLSSLKSLAFIPNNELPPLPFYVIDVGSKVLQAGERDAANGAFKDFIELIWCVEGCGRDPAVRALLPHRAQRCLLLFAGGGSRAQGDQRRLGRCTGSAFAGRCRKFVSLLSLRPLSSTLRRSARLLFFTDISNCISSPEPVQQGLACGYLMQILAKMNSWKTRQRYPDRKIDRILGFVAHNLSNPALDIDLVADTMGIPKSTLQKIFENKVSCSLGSYIRNERFQKGVDPV